jgi:transposase
LPTAGPHDGIGIWLAGRWLNEGKFVWPAATTVNQHQQLSLEQLQALVLGLPWQRLGNDGIITVV